MLELYGQCTCSEIKFKFSTDVAVAYQCHCSICRRSSGTAYSTTIMAAEKDFIWLSGESFLSSYSKSNGYSINFCRHCGSPVPNKFRDYPLYSVPVGSLDDSVEVKVVTQIYMDSKAQWDKDNLAGQQFSEMPSLDEMLALLHV